MRAQATQCVCWSNKQHKAPYVGIWGAQIRTWSCVPKPDSSVEGVLSDGIG